MKVCLVHKTPSVWKEGTSKTTGKPYAFWACTEKTGDEWCKAEQIDGPDAPEPVREPLVEVVKRGDSMLACNAVNNTTELLKMGVIKEEQFKVMAHRIYDTLVELVSGQPSEAS